MKMWRHWKRLGVSVSGVSVCSAMVLCIGPSPRGYYLVQSLRKKRVESGLWGPGLPFLRLNAKARLLGRALFFLSTSILAN